MEASLYIHFPFCQSKCDYCDFFSVPLRSSDGKLELFVNVLLAEAEKLFEKNPVDNVPTVFIGGGTPSVLGTALMRRLLKGIFSIIERFSPLPLEVTVEANPESADEAFLTAIREEGATRLSLGVQTFYSPSRNAVHRAGDAAMLPDRLALAAAFFPGAFSVDLMSGLPLQNKCVLIEDITRLASYKPAHISLYALGGKKAAGQNRDEADDLWLCGRTALEKAGYSQYEVSNFCLPGGECKHNIRYWQMRNWLALGPSASGTIINDETGTGFRFTYPSDADNWLESVNERLDALMLIKETFLMGFRCVDGPDEGSFLHRFKRPITEMIPKTFGAWRSRGLLYRDKCALTKEGLLFLNRFLLDAFEELDLSFQKLIS
jgi:oxygen-independent coproporphyrinogen III oxidase